MSPVAQPIPAEFARDTVEALCAEHRGRPWLHWWLLLGLAVALGALPLLKVDVSVRGPGLVRPAMERAELRAATGGRIARVRAHDNDRVGAGQCLVELDMRDLDERLARNRALQRERSDVVADLETLTSAYEGGDLALARPTAADPGRGLATAVLRRENAEFLARRDAGRLAMTRSRDDLERAASLAGRGVIARRELEEARYQAERARVEASLLVEQTLADWQARLRDERCALSGLVSEERRLHEERALGLVSSPVAGTVQGLTGLAAGSYVAPGQSLGQVSPDDHPVVEVLVSSRDIAFIRNGQTVRMQIDAYPYTQWGLLSGTVASVAGDALSDGRQMAFKVVVCPAALELRSPGGSSGTVRKGMTLTARFVVARRSLWQLICQGLGERLDPRAGPAPS